MSRELKKELITLGICFAVLMIVFLIPVKSIVKLFLFLIPYFMTGYTVFEELYEKIKNKNYFNESTLMCIATVGAFIIGEYFEAVIVLLLFRLGEAFEEFAQDRSRRSVAELIDRRPKTARVIYGDVEKQIPLERVSKGSLVLVRPSECIPLDGTVIDGTSSVDTSSVTGESLPTDVKPSSEVIGGTVNISGLLIIRVDKVMAESTVTKILEYVENSASGKTREERFMEKFAKVYTPAVVCVAAVIFLLGTIIAPFEWKSAAYSAITFLVISCPCALVISVPLAFFSAIGYGAKMGVLIKGSRYIELLSRCKTVVFDKTGTLTEGSFKVVGVKSEVIGEKELLELAALSEIHSNHPIANSIKSASAGLLDKKLLKRVEEIPGLGVISIIAGKTILVGNADLMKKFGVPLPKVEVPDATLVHVSIGKTYAGHIVISDSVKGNAEDALLKLKAVGVGYTVMMTGDKLGPATTVADALPSLDEYHSNLLPHQKTSLMQDIKNEAPIGSTVAFVGDGVNDAAVLLEADVGVAMGGIGSDAAITAADAVIMDDRLDKLALAINLSKKTMVVEKINIIGSVSIKFIIMLLAIIGLGNIGLAVFADVGVTILAILNSMRILYSKKL